MRTNEVQQKIVERTKTMQKITMIFPVRPVVATGRQHLPLKRLQDSPSNDN